MARKRRKKRKWEQINKVKLKIKEQAKKIRSKCKKGK